MSDYKIDSNRVLHDKNGQRIGDVDYQGNVNDGGTHKGIYNEVTGAYSNEFGQHAGYGTYGSSSSTTVENSAVNSVTGGCLMLLSLGTLWALRKINPRASDGILLIAALSCFGGLIACFGLITTSSLGISWLLNASNAFATFAGGIGMFKLRKWGLRLVQLVLAWSIVNGLFFLAMGGVSTVISAVGLIINAPFLWYLSQRSTTRYFS